MNKKIGFKDLSVPLQIAVIGSWVMGVLWIIGFLVGFIGAFSTP